MSRLESHLQRVEFKLIRMPCCGHQLCWVNPRMPMYCPECGEHLNPHAMGKDILVSDPDAVLEVHA